MLRQKISYNGVVAIAAIMIATAGMSCSHEEIPDLPEEKQVEIVLTANIAGPSETVTNTRTPEVFPGTLLPKGRTIPFGIWLTDYDSANPDALKNPVMTGTGNMKSEYNQLDEEKHTWLFHFDGEEHKRISIREGLGFAIYAYYPYVEKDFDETSDISIDRIPFMTGAHDYLWAEPVKMAKNEIKGSGSSVTCELKFKHLMSCIRLNVKCGRSSSLRLREIGLTDRKTDSNNKVYTDALIYETGHFDAATGNINAGESKTTEVNITGYDLALNKEESVPVDILIPPLTEYNDKRFELTLRFNNVEKSVSLRLPTINGKDTMEFKSGYIYTYNVEFDNKITFIKPESETVWGTGETTKISL